MVLWLGLCMYGAARTRNFVSYGFLLAGYSALLIGYQGAASPTTAWHIAVDRSSEIIIGIACSGIASVLILPRYAGEALRQSLADIFAGLAGFAAIAIRPSTPIATIVGRRRRLVSEVIKFDALRSYTRFESSELRVDEVALRRVGREFLYVLAVARGLYFRLEDFRTQGGLVLERLLPVLDATAARLARIAADPATTTDAHRTRRELLLCRRDLDEAATKLAMLAGQVPFDLLANGLLVLHRAQDMLHGLSMVIVLEAATLQAAARGRRRPLRSAPPNQISALVQALRAALTLLIVSIFWAATTWTAGFWAVTGLVVMLLVLVNQEEPAHIGWPCLVAVALAILAGYASMVFVLPRLEGYTSLSLFLILALLPAGLLIGTPRYALFGAFFGAFFVSEIMTGNVFRPDAETYANTGAGLLLGMAATLIVATGLLPIDTIAARRRAWAGMMHALPAAARAERSTRAVADDIVALLVGLLPRLDLAKERDEILLRGTLGAASISIELWRLCDRKGDPAMPIPAREALALCLDRLASAFGRLPTSHAKRADLLAEASGAVAAAQGVLASVPLTSDAPARGAVLRAAAGLRFIADILVRDRAFFLRAFTEA
jgi:uncharacterized membrane protein YccC